MSNPWIPPYFGSWHDFINSLLHNPYVGGATSSRVSATHPETLRQLEPNPSPWLTAEPSPSPWKTASSYLVSVLATKQVGLQLPEGRLQRQVVGGADKSVVDFIDDWCGTRPRPWPQPLPGPNPWTAALVSELSITAHSLQAGTLKEELLQVAGQILERSFAQTTQSETQLPSVEEIDAMATFSSQSNECQALCDDLQDTVEALAGTTGRVRQMLTARLKAIRDRMKALHCPLCLPH